MDRFKIEVEKDDSQLVFEIADYAHDEHNACKFEVYQENKMIASFEPDRRGILHICKNPGNVDDEILHKIAERIESYHW